MKPTTVEELIDKIVEEFMNYDWWDLEWELTRILEKHLTPKAKQEVDEEYNHFWCDHATWLCFQE